jgi:hypothetical protein
MSEDSERREGKGGKGDKGEIREQKESRERRATWVCDFIGRIISFTLDLDGWYVFVMRGGWR